MDNLTISQRNIVLKDNANFRVVTRTFALMSVGAMTLSSANIYCADSGRIEPVIERKVVTSQSNVNTSDAKFSLDFLVKKAREMEFNLPNTAIKNTAQDFLASLLDYPHEISFINPIPEGGVMIEFRKDGVYNVLEFYNDGDIVFVNRTSDGKMKAWDLNKDNYLQTVITEISA